MREMHENGSFKEMVESEKIGANIVDVWNKNNNKFRYH